MLKKDNSLFVGTWNVHGSLPDRSLSQWTLGTLKTDDGKEFDPDFYAIGLVYQERCKPSDDLFFFFYRLQEMETDTGAYLRYDPTKETAWVNAILASLGDKAKDYCKVSYGLLIKNRL